MWSMRPNTRASVSSRDVRIALVVNPRLGASASTPRRCVAAMPGAEVTVLAPELERASGAPDRIAVAGGDGTIAPVAAPAAELGVPLGVIPGGTANDFARVNGLPFDPVEAARLAATGTELRPLELGRLADGRPFVNSAAARPGLGRRAPRAAAEVAATGRWPTASARSGRRRPAARWRSACASTGREVFDGDAWQVIVACTGAFGGGSGIGAADSNDGDLDVVIIPAGSRARAGAAGVGAADQDDRAAEGGAALRGAGGRGGAAGGRRAQLRRRVRGRRAGARDRSGECVPPRGPPRNRGQTLCRSSFRSLNATTSAIPKRV